MESIGGSLIDRSRATLNFGADGRLHGRSSCNNYNTSCKLTGEGLSIGKAAGTRMACEPPFMAQVQRFLAILQGTTRFEIAADGALVLHAADGRTIVARR